MECCDSHGRGKHHYHAPHRDVYCPTLKQEAGGKRQQGRIGVGHEGREIIGKRDEGTSAHATDYKCQERLFNDIVGKQ